MVAEEGRGGGGGGGVEQTGTEKGRKRDYQQLLRCKDGKPLKAKKGVKFILQLFAEMEVLTRWISSSRHSGRYGAGVAGSSQLRVRPAFPDCVRLCSAHHHPITQTSPHSPDTVTGLDLGKGDVEANEEVGDRHTHRTT